jgi:hypothetical protein
LLHRSSDGGSADAASDPYAAALQKFSTMSLPDRAAEVLAGIAPALEADTNFQDKTQRKLLDVWIPEPAGRWPESMMALWALLAEAWAALEGARLVVAADAGRDSGGALTFYWLTDDGRAALAAGDVAAVVSRRLPN